MQVEGKLGGREVVPMLSIIVETLITNGYTIETIMEFQRVWQKEILMD